MLKTSRIATAVVYSLCLLLLSACSDDKPEQTTNKQPYDPIFNPSPEQIAKRNAEQKARLPFTNELPALPKADRGEYIDMMEPLMPLRVYVANRNWDETPERVADDIGKIFARMNPKISPKFIEMTEKYAAEQNAFEKADLAKAIADFAQEQAEALKGERLVKIVLDNHMAQIMPYDLEAHAFKVNTSLFTDKTSYTQKERDAMQRAYRILTPLKGYLFSTPGSYQYGFTGASALENILVDDEIVARKLEASRQNASIIVYGYVARVQREHNKGTPVEDPYTFIQPHFADIVSSSGEIVYSIDF